jgi:hypothetical protein
MGVDLTFASFAQRRSLVLLDDQLVELQHAMTHDRVRRIHFDRLESVLAWRRIPRFRLLVVFAVLGVPGVLLIAVGDPGTIGAGVFLLVVMLLVTLYYVYHGRTTIRLTRAGQNYEYAGVIRRGRVLSFLARLEQRARLVQTAPSGAGAAAPAIPAAASAAHIAVQDRPEIRE